MADDVRIAFEDLAEGEPADPAYRELVLSRTG
jgi:hypothetical protein